MDILILPDGVKVVCTKINTMAKIRTIKPELWDDEKLGGMKRDCRLLFIGLLSFADDSGVIKSNPTFIKNRIFPYDEDLRVSEVTKWLTALVEARMLIPFDYNKEGYYNIRTFCAHQVIDKRYERHIVPPHIVEELQKMQNTTWSHSDNIVTTPQEGKGRERKGKEGNRDALPAPEVPLQGEEENPPSVAQPPPHQTGPSLDEVKAFMRGAGGSDEMAEGFWLKWKAVGWMDGITPIKNWTYRANGYIATWNRNEKDNRKGEKKSFTEAAKKW